MEKAFIKTCAEKQPCTMVARQQVSKYKLLYRLRYWSVSSDIGRKYVRNNK